MTELQKIDKHCNYSRQRQSIVFCQLEKNSNSFYETIIEEITMYYLNALYLGFHYTYIKGCSLNAGFRHKDLDILWGKLELF